MDCNKEQQLVDSERFRHCVPIQIRFNDVDRFGHINNNAYFSYYDLGKEKYLQDVLKSDYQSREVVPVIASIHADFIHPIFSDDEITVETRISRIGEKSFTLEQQAVNEKTQMVMCRCSTVMVCFSLSTQLSVEVPDSFRKAISEYEGRKF